jgi:hypothetical protein
MNESTTDRKILLEAKVALSNLVSDVESGRHSASMEPIPQGSTVKCFVYWDCVTAAHDTIKSINKHLEGKNG